MKRMLLLTTKKNREARNKSRRTVRKSNRKNGRKYISEYNKQLGVSQKRMEQNYKDYITSTKIGKDAMKEKDVPADQ